MQGKPTAIEADRSSGSAVAWVSIAVAAAAFAWLGLLAWQGRLGLLAMALLAVSAGCFMAGRRRLAPETRGSVDLIGKTVFTIAGCVALLRHPIPIASGEHAPIHTAIANYIGQVDARVFVLFAVIAMAVKFLGVISSAYSWHLLLVGQGIRYPFWSQIMTSFLIGRFIGTFLPGTLGLDGYTLYEASHYSNQWQRSITAKALEKVIGSAGLFLGMVLTLPFGYSVIQDVTAQVGRPEAAPLLAAVVVLVAGGISGAVTLGLVRPVLLTRTMRLFGQLLPGRVGGQVEQFTQAVGAYRGQVGLLLLALVSKFVTHFTTAAVYYFTALAIGVTGAHFWPIVFGSTIQIVATVFSPTIAGEGAREAFQALLLSKHLGGVAQAVLSAALGFLAAEAATLWGGAFMWTRKTGRRPHFTLVDGKQVDYGWLEGDESMPLRRSRLAAVAGR
jgi:hypothetical protein